MLGIALAVLGYLYLDRVLAAEVERHYRHNRQTAEAFSRDPIFFELLRSGTRGPVPALPGAIRRF